MKQEFVDLGLPSGTLWAKHNVKIANKKHFTHSQAIKIAEYLHYNLPSKENFEELINLCKWKWMKLFGRVTGYKVTGPNGNYIFLSAAGFYDGTSLDLSGTCGYYWSTRFSYNDSAYVLGFSSNYKSVYYGSRYCGLSIRLIKR